MFCYTIAPKVNWLSDKYGMYFINCKQGIKLKIQEEKSMIKKVIEYWFNRYPENSSTVNTGGGV